MNADEIPSYFGCSSHDAYLDCMLPGVKVTPGLIFFLCSASSGVCKDYDSLFYGSSLLCRDGKVRIRNYMQLTCSYIAVSCN